MRESGLSVTRDDFPPRCWGVGLVRTGNTSFCEALTLLGYDAAILTASFHRHHADVRRDFADRPDDLLEMDITAGDGWDKLCPFLSVPVPEAAFPRLNAGVPAT